MRLDEWLGHLLGTAVAPAFAALARARRARALHAEGVLHRGHVSALPHDDPAFEMLASRLEGPALLRFSAAFFADERAPDLLGIAIRFCSTGIPSCDADGCDQDLLLATTPGLLRVPLALARTDVHDWLGNVYYGAASFDVDGIGRAKLRVRPGDFQGPRKTGREDRLDLAVALGEARLTLELRRRGHAHWTPIAVIEIDDRVTLDERELRFTPYLDARGLRPVGFVHAMRGATYSASSGSRRETPMYGG